MTFSPIEVKADQARRFTLSRHFLSKPAAGPEEAVRRLVAIQCQYESSFPLAAWARCPATSPDWAQSALLDSRTVAKTWCMRSTVHAMMADDYAMVVGATAPVIKVDAWHRHFEQVAKLTPDELRKVESQVLDALDAGPLARNDLHRAVPRLSDIPYIGWGLDVKLLAFRGHIIFAGSKGPFPVFARTDRWFADFRFEVPDDALAELFRRYVSGYGPVSRADFRRWTGLKTKPLSDAFSRLEPDLVPVRVTGEECTRYVLAEHEGELRSDGAEPPRASLLPKFDALVAFRDTTRFVPGQHIPRVFRPAGQIEACVLLGDQIRATWRLRKRGRVHEVAIEPFGSLSKIDRSAIEGEARRLGRFLGNDCQVILSQGSRQ